MQQAQVIICPYTCGGRARVGEKVVALREVHGEDLRPCRRPFSACSGDRRAQAGRIQAPDASGRQEPLLALLDAERAHAESEDAPHFNICGSNRRADTKIPAETQRIYDCRAYHDERREGFPLFNIWGEPWPKRGRPKRVNEDPETEAAAARSKPQQDARLVMEGKAKVLLEKA